MAFEEGAGVVEVLFGIGSGETLKRFVEDADDPLLFGERRENDGKFSDVALIKMRRCRNIEPRINDLLKVGTRQAAIEKFRENVSPTFVYSLAIKPRQPMRPFSSTNSPSCFFCHPFFIIML